MKLLRASRWAFLSVVCIYFVALMAVFSAAEVSSAAKIHKVKITGPILLNEDGVLKIMNEKDGSVHGFRLTDKTTIRSTNGFLHGSTVMSGSALVPSLTVEVEGTGTRYEMPQATTIKFSRDELTPTETDDNRRCDRLLLLSFVCQGWGI